MVRYLRGSCLLLLGCQMAAAQTALGSIVGNVRDEVTHQPLALASVTVSRPSNLVITTSTDSKGHYTLRDLPPDTYILRVTNGEAYRPSEIRDLTVPVSGLIIQSVTLRRLTDIWQSGLSRSFFAGQSSSVVPFYGPDIDLSRWATIEWSPEIRGELQPALSRDVSQAELLNLPLSGRDPYGLLVLQPGVANDVSTLRGFGVSVNGQRPSASSFLLDGFQNNDYLSTGVQAVLPPEATQEYRISTSNFSAEFGGTSGYLANAITVSGSNSLHGMLYADVSNQLFNAVDFQDQANGGAAPAQQIAVGGQIGNPIVPNRIFNFASLWLNRDQASAGLAPFVAPTENFLKALIPGTLAQSLFSRFPGPVAPGNGLTGTVYLRPEDAFSRVDGLDRVDWNAASNRQHAFAKVIVDRLTEPDFIWSTYPDFRSALDRNVSGVGVAQAGSWGPHWSEESRAGYAQDYIGWARAQPQIPLLAYVEPGSSGTGFFGSPAGYTFRNHGKSIEASTNFGYSTSRQVLSFGANYFARQLSAEYSTPGANEYNFFSPVNLLAEEPKLIFLAASRTPFTQGESAPPELARTYRYWQMGAYLQDSIRVTDRLLFHVGVRYEYFGPPRNVGTTPDTLVQLGSAGSMPERIQNAQLTEARQVYSSDPRNWAPRVGVVYDATKNGSLLFRASYGIFYDRPFDNLWLNVSLNASLPVRTKSCPADPNPCKINYLGSPTAILNQLSANPGLIAQPALLDLTLFQPNFRTPYSQSFFAGFQKRIRNSMLAEVEYSGSRGHDLLTTDLLNRGCTPCEYNNDPGLNGTFQYRANMGISNYNALVSSFLIRARALYASFSYTWSHSIDNQSEPLAGATADLAIVNQLTSLTTEEASFTREFDSNADRGNSDFDQRQVFSSYATWSVPTASGSSLTRRIFQNWLLSEVSAFRTGTPFSVFAGSSGLLVNNRADLINPALARKETPYPGGRILLDEAAFSQPPFGQLGNTGRNAFTGPGAYNINVSISRTFRIANSERWQITLRADAFNALNHANLNNPSNENLILPMAPLLPGATPFAFAAYGRSASTIGLPIGSPVSESARQIHFVVRLLF